MLDRLLHRSVVLDIAGDSYRLRGYQAQAAKYRMKAIVLNVKSRLGELRGGPRERSEGISDPDAAVASVAMAHALPGSALGTRFWARLRPGSCPGAGGDSGASYRPLATARRQILTWDRIARTGRQVTRARIGRCRADPGLPSARSLRRRKILKGESGTAHSL